MKLYLDLPGGSYDILIEEGILTRASEHLSLDRKVAIITDDGVPSRYAEAVATCCKHPTVITLPQGEASKSLDSFTDIQQLLLTGGFTRSDAIVAVGGGVCGDLAGFCAATYMRGIDFYNIPTTLLSQVDSSVGGKTAVNFAGYKNMIGSFYQPKKVLIDPAVLSTLPPRQLACGMAEVIKMAITRDAALFEKLEQTAPYTDLSQVIYSALAIKAAVVAADEKEGGLRKVLNFGHTAGHAIEHLYGFDGAAEGEDLLYHGECVAIGMLPLTAPAIRQRLQTVLTKYNLPLLPPAWKNGFSDGMAEVLTEAILHDKKAGEGAVSFVLCDGIGTHRFEKLDQASILQLMNSWTEQAAHQ